MVQRHVAGAGAGQGGALAGTLEGFRPVGISGPGIIVRGRSDDLRVGVALVADPLVLLAVGGEQQALHWVLLPGGPSVTARADGLRLLRGLAAGGQLTFRLGSRKAMPPLAVDEGVWDGEDEWRLFEDLAVLEEWSGVTIPMPRAVSGSEATRVAQAASWARTQQIDAQVLDAITFTATAVDPVPEECAEVRLHQDFGLDALGVEIPLGEGAARAELRDLRRDNGGQPTYRAWPAQADLSFRLTPPPSRRLPARRTQPVRVSPPLAPRRGGAATRAFTRPARYRLAEVLAARRPAEIAAADRSRGTGGFLDDVRGE